MANKGLNMTNIEEIQRLKSLGVSQLKVSQLLGMSRKTVIKYWNSSLDQIPTSGLPEWFTQLDKTYLKEELEKGVSKKLLHEELSVTNDLPSYQFFSSFLKKHITLDKPRKISLKQDRAPGHSIEVDYSGNSIPIMSPTTGELKKTEMFVGALSCSSYIYMEFTESQRSEDFLRSHINMFNYFGGLSRYIVVDNLKSGVTKAHKFDPVVNKSFNELCKYYGVTVDPARSFTPQDKPVVENAVGIIQKDFFPRVRNKTYTSLHDLNEDAKDYLKDLNTRIMKARGESRFYFYQQELKYLKPLPKNDYEIFYFKQAKVHPDCHIQHEKNFYSVPYRYVGQRVDLKYNSKLVHILVEAKIIATHSTVKGSGLRSTNEQHYPERSIVDANYHLKSCFKKAVLIGESTQLFFENLLKTPKHPLKNLRKAQSILSFEKKYGKEVLESACKKALLFGQDQYHYVKACCEHYESSLKKEKNNIKPPQRDPDHICIQRSKDENDKPLSP